MARWCSPSTCTSTLMRWTSAPRRAPTWIRSCATSTGSASRPATDAPWIPPRPSWPNPDVPKVTAAELRAMLDRGEDVTLVDVCLPENLSWRTDTLPGARFLRPAAIADWAGDLPRDKPVVAYCIYGFQVSSEATAELRRRGLDARALAGGIAAWHAMGGPTVPLTPERKGGPCDDEVGYARAPEDRPHRLPLADPALRRARGR